MMWNKSQALLTTRIICREIAGQYRLECIPDPVMKRDIIEVQIQKVKPPFNRWKDEKIALRVEWMFFRIVRIYYPDAKFGVQVFCEYSAESDSRIIRICSFMQNW